MAEYSFEQIRNIEKKNKELEEKIKKYEKDFESRNNAKFDEFRRLMRLQFQEHNEKTRSEYESRLAKLKYDISSEIEGSEREILEQYDVIRKEMLKARREFEEENARLQRKIDSIAENDARVDEQQHKDAEEQLKEAYETLSEVDELPCETFYSGKLSIHNTTVESVKDLIKRKLYQAAIAVSISAKAAISIFGIDVKKQMELWEKEYRKFEGKVKSLVKMRDDWHSEWIEAEEDENLSNKECADIDICFWTNNEYEKCKNKVEEWEKLINSISETGITKYLKGKEIIGFDQLMQMSVEADALADNQKLLYDLYSNCLAAYDERYIWADRIIKYLKEEKSFNFDSNSSGYDSIPAVQIKKDYIRKYLKMYDLDGSEDVRGMFRMFFDRNDGDGLKVEIGIIPIRIGCSSVVQNIVRFHVNLNDRSQIDQEYIDLVFRSIESAIKQSKTANSRDVDIKSSNDTNVLKQMSKAKNVICRQWAAEQEEKRNAINNYISV